MNFDPHLIPAEGTLFHRAVESQTIDFSQGADEIQRDIAAAMASVTRIIEVCLTRLPENAIVTSINWTLVRGAHVPDPEHPDDPDKSTLDLTKGCMRAVIIASYPTHTYVVARASGDLVQVDAVCEERAVAAAFNLKWNFSTVAGIFWTCDGKEVHYPKHAQVIKITK